MVRAALNSAASLCTHPRAHACVCAHSHTRAHTPASFSFSPSPPPSHIHCGSVAPLPWKPPPLFTHTSHQHHSSSLSCTRTHLHNCFLATQSQREKVCKESKARTVEVNVMKRSWREWGGRTRLLKREATGDTSWLWLACVCYLMM